MFLRILRATDATQPSGGVPDKSVDDEAGAVENRMSIDPGDKRWPDVTNWEDGETYTGTVKVRQISAGEFEVVSFTPQADGAEKETPAEDATETEETDDAPGGMPMRSKNPAINSLMS